MSNETNPITNNGKVEKLNAGQNTAHSNSPTKHSYQTRSTSRSRLQVKRNTVVNAPSETKTSLDKPPKQRGNTMPGVTNPQSTASEPSREKKRVQSMQNMETQFKTRDSSEVGPGTSKIPARDYPSYRCIQYAVVARQEREALIF